MYWSWSELKQRVMAIKTPSDYESALMRLSALMSVDQLPGSRREAEMEILALLIESYEHGMLNAVAE